MMAPSGTPEERLEQANALLIQISMERGITLREAGDLAVWLHAEPEYAKSRGFQSGDTE